MTWTNLLAILIGVFYPIYLLLTYKKTYNEIQRDETLKLNDYKQTIIIFWVLTILILVNHIVIRQPDLNFHPKFNLVGIILLILVLVFAIIQYKSSNVNQDNYSIIKEKLKHIYLYLPKTKVELNWFIALSISAGICEEIIFRLFLYEFLNEIIGLWGAIILANTIFALTHIGSGKLNLISAFILGLLFSAIYYFSENIWIAVLLHIIIDINSGILGYKTKTFEIEK